MIKGSLMDKNMQSVVSEYPNLAPILDNTLARCIKLEKQLKCCCEQEVQDLIPRMHSSKSLRITFKDEDETS